jgi:hypothetical protein
MKKTILCFLAAATIFMGLPFSDTHPAQMKFSGDLEVKGDVILKEPLQPLIFPDGTDQNTASRPYCSTVIVSPAATASESGANLLAALSKINDASSAKRYLIKIEPGIYDVGTGSVSMKPYVDMEGSGENCTKIAGAPDARYLLGVVNGSSNASLRLLTVEHMGGVESAAAIYNSSSALTVYRVRVIASATDHACGIENSSSQLDLSSSSIDVISEKTAVGVIADNSELTMKDFTIKSTGSSGSRGLRIYDSSFILGHGAVTTQSEFSLTSVQAEASGAETNDGISTNHSVVVIRDSLIKGSGGDYAIGIYNHSSSLDITASVVEGSGGSTINAGMLIEGDPGSVTGLHSTFKGADWSIAWGEGWTFDLAGCKLDGFFGTAIGTWRCAVSYTGSYAPLNSGCNAGP